MEESKNGRFFLSGPPNGERDFWNRRSVEILAFFLLAALMICLFYVQHVKTVFIVDENTKIRVYTFSRTVENLVQEKNLDVGEHDRITPGKDHRLSSGDTIRIQRAMPVTIDIDGEAREAWTHSQTVSAVLREEGVKLKEDDRVSPDLNARIDKNETIEITRTVLLQLAETEYIPFETVRMNNPELEPGAVRTVQEGVPGVRENVFELEKNGGKEMSRTLVSSHVIQEPINRILEYGDHVITTRSGRYYEYDQALEVMATAYCPGTPGSGCPVDSRGAAHCTGFYNDGYTFNGTRAVAGDGSMENPHIIAVDPAVIPLDSLVYIEGYGIARAEDTGSAIKGNIIDLLFDQHDDALRFGRKNLRVYVLSE